MQRDDEAGVEFVDAEPDGGADEELGQPAGFPRLRRARLPLFAVAAVALIGLVVVTVVTGPSGSPSAAPATVTVAPSPSESLTTPSALPSNGVTFSLRSGLVAVLQPPSGHRSSSRLEVLPTGVTCPLGSSCATLFRTPAAVRAAVRHDLPEAGDLQAVTTIVHADLPGSQLLFRRVTGRIGSARLVVTVRGASRRDEIGWNDSENARRAVVSATQHVDGRLVTVRVTAPPGFGIDIAAVRRLAADARLGRLA